MSKNRGLLLIGGGGHCKSVIDCVLSSDEFDRIGIIVNENPISVLGIPVVGTDIDLPLLFQDGWTDAFISLGSIGTTLLRHKLYTLVKSIGFNLPSISDPSALIARDTVLEEGVFVGKRVIINSGSKVGACAILNTGAIIEHDCEIGSFSHISPGTVLCGNVRINSDSHIGAGSVIRQGITVGCCSLIGAGSVVVKDIPNNVLAYGNPCKVIN